VTPVGTFGRVSPEYAMSVADERAGRLAQS
jgi:hypothetical protein